MREAHPATDPFADEHRWGGTRFLESGSRETGRCSVQPPLIQERIGWVLVGGEGRRRAGERRRRWREAVEDRDAEHWGTASEPGIRPPFNVFWTRIRAPHHSWKTGRCGFDLWAINGPGNHTKRTFGGLL